LCHHYTSCISSSRAILFFIFSFLLWFFPTKEKSQTRVNFDFPRVISGLLLFLSNSSLCVDCWCYQMVLRGRFSILTLFLSALRVQISVLPVIKGGRNGKIINDSLSYKFISSWWRHGVFPRSNNTVVLNDLLFVCCFCFKSFSEKKLIFYFILN
jgi:hypothetical protein